MPEQQNTGGQQGPGGTGGQQQAGMGGQQQNQQAGAGGGTPTWEAVLEGLPEEQRALYETHTGGLRSALDSERTQRRDLARQLREATQQLEEGSEARQQLESLNDRLEAAERRADFLEQAMDPEIGCTNPRLAYLAAQEIEAIDQRGRVNWEEVRRQFPELFYQQGAPAPAGNAGAGTGSRPGGTADMDTFIRRRAGVVR